MKEYSKNSPKVNEEKENNSGGKNNKRLLIIGLVVLIVIIFCCVFAIIIIFSEPKHEQEDIISSKSIVPTNTPTNIPAPIMILNENLDFTDGISISIDSFTRSLSEIEDQQNIKISYSIVSKNTLWTGFQFEAEEWILDTDYGRVSAKSVTNDCLIHDNENCSAVITFTLPIDVQKVTLYYVSNRRFDDLDPIQVEDPDDRRFVAELNLASKELPQTKTPEPSKTITPSQTFTPTSLYTPTVTATPTITLTPTRTNTPTKTEVPTYDVYDIYRNYLNLTELQFNEYKNEIIGKQISSLVQIGQVTDNGKLLLSGEWSAHIINYYDFCVVVELVPNDVALSIEKGEYIQLKALINGIVGDNRYYWNCETTLVLNYVSHK